jgi:hypothetical protein
MQWRNCEKQKLSKMKTTAPSQAYISTQMVIVLTTSHPTVEINVSRFKQAHFSVKSLLKQLPHHEYYNLSPAEMLPQ